MLDRARLLPLFEQLARQLAELDPEAAETVQALEPLTQGSELAVKVRTLAEAVANYEFEEAALALQALRAS